MFRGLKESNIIDHTNKVMKVILGVLFLTFMTFNILSALDIIPLRYKFVVTLTDSMEPTIMTNSISLVEKVKIDDINVGDIIVYKSHVGFDVIHRVVYKVPDGLITKGDANVQMDTYPVTDEMLKYRVVKTFNNVSGIMTTLFGNFQELQKEIKDKNIFIEYIGMRVILVLEVLAIIFVFLGLGICWVYEFLTINYFFAKYGDSLVDSSLSWVEKRESPEILKKLIKDRNQGSILNRLKMRFEIMRVYKSFMDERDRVYRTHKLIKKYKG